MLKNMQRLSPEKLKETRQLSQLPQHCVKIICIHSFSAQYFSAFGLNTERFSPNAGKYVPEELHHDSEHLS